MISKLKKLEEKPLEPLVLRLLSTWSITSILFVLYLGADFTAIENMKNISLLAFCIVFLVVFGVICLVAFKKKKPVERRLLPVTFGIYSAFTSFITADYWFVFILTALWAVLLFYYEKQGYLRLKKPFTEKRRKRVFWISVGGFILLVGGIGVMRYVSYRAPNFDFGIFAQMYHNMATKFVPVTTCERDGLLSHFAVHISPIYYVLLPFYWIFPSPVTLQISQAVMLASAAIPLNRLCRRYQLRPWISAGLCVLLLVYPAVVGGTEYDFHENCFLLPLLLWVFCFFEEERWIPMAVFAALTLLVKEDAAVYIIFFAIYVILGRKKYGVGAAMIAGAGVYFVIALYLLKTYGDGVMEGRYSNFIANDGGLLEAVKNVLANPGYAFTQMLIDNEDDYAAKLLFLFQMFTPLAFLPFCVKKVPNLLLLLPMVLLNLLTLYPYQYVVTFQYSFGVTAFVFYLTVLNLGELQPAAAKRFMCIALACGAVSFFAGPMDMVVRCSNAYFGKLDEVSKIHEVVSSIPKEASVVASAYFTPHLSKHETLYEVYYHEPADGEVLDYVLLDMRFDYERYIPKYEKLGYKVTRTVENKEGEIILVMMQPDPVKLHAAADEKQ